MEYKRRRNGVQPREKGSTRKVRVALTWHSKGGVGFVLVRGKDHDACLVGCGMALCFGYRAGLAVVVVRHAEHYFGVAKRVGPVVEACGKPTKESVLT